MTLLILLIVCSICISSNCKDSKENFKLYDIPYTIYVDLLITLQYCFCKLCLHKFLIWRHGPNTIQKF